MLRVNENSLYSHAVKLRNGGRFDEAARIFERLIACAPEYAAPYIALSDMAQDAGHYAQAVALAWECWRRTAAPESLGRLGASYLAAGEVTRAIGVYRHALSVAPDDADLWHDLALALLDAGEVPTAQAQIKRSLTISRDSRREANLLMVLQYLTDCPATLGAAHTAWVKRYSPAAPPLMKRTSKPAPRLRVGILSPDFRRHPVAYFLLPLLQHATQARMDVLLYSDDCRSDDMTSMLQSYAAGWRSVAGLSDYDVQNILAAAKLHVLVDGAGHTSTRLGVYTRRVAPLQVSWPGYYHPLHHPGIDGLLLDEFTACGLFEGVLPISPTRFCYSPCAYAPAVAEPPSLRNHGHVTFGSFNNLWKLSAETVALWSRVLQAVPGSRLLLKWRSLGDAGVRAAVFARFRAHGVGGDRLDLRGHSPHAAMLAEYGDVDIALDPSPFGGGLTSFESLWMGVPVLTLPGRSPASRQTGAALSCLGMGDWVASSHDDFVSRAVALSMSASMLADLRAGQRQRMAASRLCDGTRFAAELRGVFVRALGWQAGEGPGRPAS